MRTGRLRHRVTVQKFTTARDGYGQDIETWANHVTVWASVEPLRSKEFYAEQQLNSEITAQIVIRWRDDINEKDRIIHGSHSYEVVGQPVNPDMRNRELLIRVKELS